MVVPSVMWLNHPGLGTTLATVSCFIIISCALLMLSPTWYSQGLYFPHFFQRLLPSFDSSSFCFRSLFVVTFVFSFVFSAFVLLVNHNLVAGSLVHLATYDYVYVHFPSCPPNVPSSLPLYVS